MQKVPVTNKATGTQLCTSLQQMDVPKTNTLSMDYQAEVIHSYISGWELQLIWKPVSGTFLIFLRQGHCSTQPIADRLLLPLF